MQAVPFNGGKFGAPIRYRLVASGEWLTGEIAEFKGPELVFFCDRPLEVSTNIEIVVPIRVQAIVGEAVLSMVCTAEVVRRILLNWPEVRPALAVHISSCQIAADASSDGAASSTSQSLLGEKDESKSQ